MRKSRLFSPGFMSISKLTESFRGQIFKTLVLGISGVLAGTLAMAQLSGGNYTINSGSPTGGGNFNSFADFVSALSTNSNAISGAVTVTVVQGSGPYNEQLVLPNISGTGPGPGGTRIGITFIGNGETIEYSGSGATENATITLNGADYITFQNLVIKRGTSGSYRWGVRLTNQATAIRFDSCTIDVGSYSTTYQIGILGSGSNTSYSTYGVHWQDLEILNCDIIGGYGGVWSYGSSSTTANWVDGIHIKNCNFEDQYYYPLRLYYGHYNINVEGCYFSKPTQSYQYGYACYIYRANNVSFTKNHNVGYCYGFYISYINYYYTSLVSGRSLVANNMCAPQQGAAATATSAYGLYLYYNTDMDVFYNSVNLENRTSTCYMLYNYYAVGMNVKNNAFRAYNCTSSIYAHYMYNPSGSWSSDYNTWDMDGQIGTIYMYAGTTSYNSVSQFISSSGSNANSQEAQCFFVSSTDLHTNGANLYQKGVLVSVSDDFDGTARPSVPSHGAHEFVPPQHDAGVFTFVNPVAVCADTNMVEVTVKNYGAMPLTSFTLYLETSGLGITGTLSDSVQVSATPGIAPGGDTTIYVRDVVMQSGAPGYFFKAWTHKPNGNVDQQFNNDTLYYSTQTAMEGTFTIGGTTPDFTTFTAAVNALNNYGVCGPVVFNVRDAATYSEHVTFDNLTGVSSTNTVTFQSDTANSGMPHIEASVSTYNEGTIDFANSGWIFFDGIEIEGLSTSYGHAVAMRMGSHDITFSNCRLLGPSTSTTSNYMSVVYAYDPGLDRLNFIDNVFEGGSYGIYYYGYNSGAGNYSSKGGVVSGNTVTDAYYMGMYLGYLDSLYVIDNYIDVHNGYGSSYGMYTYCYYSNYLNVQNNEVHSNYYGIYCYMSGTSQSQPMFTNNKFHIGGSMSSNGAYYGTLYYAGYGTFAYNTVVSEYKSYAYYNLYVGGGLNSIYNNILVRDGSGYCIYNSSSFGILNSDNNNFSYINGATCAYNAGSTASDLAAWQNMGFDANGTNAQHVFDNYDSLFTCNDTLVGAGMPLSNVGIDYNYASRSATAPTIGPEEYVSPDGFSLGGDDIMICDGDTVELGTEVSGATYLWSTNETSPTILVTSVGTYSVQVTSGCGVAEDEIEITSGASAANFAWGASYRTAIFTDGSLNADTYSWDFGDNTALSTDENPVHLYAANGTYTVCLTVTGECGTDQFCSDVTVHDHVGIEEFGAGNVNIYPNPASNDLYLQVSGVEGMMMVEVSNIAGQVVLSNQFEDYNNGSREQLSVSNLIDGVYFVKVMANNTSVTKRIVVQK